MNHVGLLKRAGLLTFHNGVAEIKELSKEEYLVTLKSKHGRELARVRVLDSLYDTWQGFTCGCNVFDLNIFDNKQFGKGNAKYGAVIYPVYNGNTDTSKYECLTVVDSAK